MMKVLIVDDQPELRHVLRICLSAAGLEILEAGNGQKALAAVKEHSPEIVILDVMLPDVNGIEVCSQIRQTAPGMSSYIIMLSARTEITHRVTGLESGADAYLTKPFEPQEIMAQLRVGIRAVENRKSFLTDPLTGIFGRRAFDALLDQTIARSHRHQVPLSLAMIDIDNFKMVNDSGGHATGDAVLREFAELLCQEARESDLYFRWGGEEFTWLLSDTDLAGARIATDRFREMVTRKQFAAVGSLTVSIGVAVLNEAENGASLCARADAALYRAKDGGRNRVECDQPQPLSAIRA
jgi:diguanylate cyclase (GGDEF)-like protein